MKPVVALRNLTPSSTAELSLTVTVAGTAVLAQMLHGQADVVTPVVNDQEKGAIRLLARSLAPLTVSVCRVDAASAAVGVNVTVRVGGSYATLPETVVPAVRATVAVPVWMDSLNVAVTLVLRETPVAFAAGLLAVT